ncbi:putative efflux protein, MATE family [Roseivivax lentus]|uniref:Putative efflux protein, MATE family n=1 Tax=Roseivivax lentus TaxID=633194 RepID=A0A1N7K4P2_9RHOB|nr:MATE family efflux transporter [Roseivivax lentus]SIS56517.1 putative efflux protein, MATE family [Roseivivax lentus]
MAGKLDLNDKSVPRALWQVSAPMAIGILGVLSVGLADSYFLARAGEDELAAIGFIYPVIVAITSLSIGLSAGTSAVVSQALGANGGDDSASARLALHALIVAASAATLVAGLLYVAASWLFGLMGAEGAVLDGILAYMPWWCAGFPFIVAGQSLNAVFRAGGEARIAASVMMSQAIINIVLDPILIFGFGPVPALGIEGAGIATATARILAFLGCLAFAIRTARLDISNCSLTGFGTSAWRIVKVGGPASLSNAINPAGMAAVTAAVAIIGASAVGGFGAATRVQNLLFVPMLALSAGIGPVVGQAWGAGDKARARETVRLTFLLCLGYGIAVSALLWLTAGPIARVMTNGLQAVPYAEQYLRWVSVSFFGYGILVTANAAMNAREKPLFSLSLSLGRIGLLYVPLAWVGAYTLGYSGILAAAVAANLGAVLGAIVLCRRTGVLGALGLGGAVRAAGAAVPPN